MVPDAIATPALEGPFHGTWCKNLVAFADFLRHTPQRFSLGPQEIAEGLQALEAVDLGCLQEVRQALKLVLCSNLEQERAFDDLFFQFFLPSRRRPHLGQARPGGEGESGEQGPAPQQNPSHLALEGPGPGGKSTPHSYQNLNTEDWAAPLRRAMFSRNAGREADEVEIPQQDLDEMLQAATRLVNQVRLGRSRRWALAPRGVRLHFRRTLRKALHTGGDPIHPAWLQHPKRQPRFVFVLDGSRSMHSYADRLLQFAFALRMRCNRVEVFVFSTQLKRITRQLEQAKSLAERPRLERLGLAWGGGTQIGESLLALERTHAGLIRGDAIVIIASDGLDTGAPQVLQQALRQLYLRSAALIWLNPLLHSQGYDPQATGMRAALPYLDRFCAANTPPELALLTHRLRLRK
ncbi:vWA domain-containing protein [Meiothermus rufus]|uniref:vWA domain-containing protein n=1 Tax=Meiothermus rufus TaxID=604332 RepID=UPI000414B5E4|nr:VWA domain-containing protein [Meiothermus rufus]